MVFDALKHLIGDRVCQRSLPCCSAKCCVSHFRGKALFDPEKRPKHGRVAQRLGEPLDQITLGVRNGMKEPVEAG